MENVVLHDRKIAENVMFHQLHQKNLRGGGGSVPPAATFQTEPTCSTALVDGNVEVTIIASTSKNTDFRIVCDSVGHNPSWGEAPDYGYDYFSELSDVYPSNMTRQHSETLSLSANVDKYYCLALADEHYSGRKEIRAEVLCEVPQSEIVASPVPIPIPTPEPECNYLLEYIKLGADNNPYEVEKLEKFLNDYEGESLVVNGIYEKSDFEAVKRFQSKYGSEVLSPWGLKGPTGYVYYTTKKKVNELYCQREFPLTDKQKNEINYYKGSYAVLTETLKIKK